MQMNNDSCRLWGCCSSHRPRYGQTKKCGAAVCGLNSFLRAEKVGSMAVEIFKKKFFLFDPQTFSLFILRLFLSVWQDSWELGAARDTNQASVYDDLGVRPGYKIIIISNIYNCIDIYGIFGFLSPKKGRGLLVWSGLLPSHHAASIADIRVISYLNSRAYFIDLRALFIDFTFRFCDIVSQNSALALKFALLVLKLSAG